MIKFNCPSCKQIIEAPDEIVRESSATCPTCQHQFNPQIFAARPDPDQLRKVDGIRFMAEKFTQLAVLLLIVGVLDLLFAIAWTIDRGDAGNAWKFASTSFLSSTWFYLIAQVIHIRALLAKRP